MDCFDVSLGLHALLGVSLIVAGANLMLQMGSVARGYGAYCFAFGYLVLGLAAAGRDLGDMDRQSRRFMLGVGSALAVVAGTFMMYYHLQERVRDLLKNRLQGTPNLSEDIVKSIPIIDNVLIYVGYAGLVLAVGMDENNNINVLKSALALGAILVIGYTKNKMLEAVVSNVDAQKHQLAHILSWGLLVLAIAYRC